MWYDMLPVMGILGSLCLIPHIIPTYINEWKFGNPMRRRLEKDWDRRMFERDSALTGKVWQNAGLENIPDK